MLYLAYLDGDVTRLELDPSFRDYVGESFKPLGVYVNFWQPSLAAKSERSDCGAERERKVVK